MKKTGNQKSEDESKKRSKWTEEEVAILKKYYAKLVCTGIIRKFGLNRTENAIMKKAKALGLTKRAKSAWTRKEIEALLRTVEKHPYNLNEAYRLFAKQSGRSRDGVRLKFYELRNIKDTKTCMMTISGNNYAINRKNIYQGVNAIPTRNNKSKWRRILDILLGK